MTTANARKRTLGVCYYPEHWPEDSWATDAALMAETGLTWVRIGEFAWSRIEPSAGDLRWDWLDRAIATLGKAGLKVVLGTPTATPPRWMIEKWPDMLAVDKNNDVRKFGSRRHYCFSHVGYREESARITQLLAERYGNNPHVAAWQTDNEYGCHDTVHSYGASALAGFRTWLEAKYTTIEALNAAWGNVFWSMDYDRFDQIELPNQTVTEPNPSHELDYRRFSSDAVVEFNRIQTDILRKYSKAPLAHNYMGKTTEFDHFAVGDDLDIASWDSYPLGFLEQKSLDGDAHKAEYMRQGDPDFQAFHHDIYRAVGKGRWWVMEQQPGPVNWAPYNPAPLPGMARLWAWEAFAHGAEAVCYFRWRQAPFAQEQMHAGLLRPDSQPAPALGEAASVARELSSNIDALGDADAGQPSVALVFDYVSMWAWVAQPQGQSFDYFQMCFEYYRALRKLGLSVDILRPDTDDLSAYKVVVMPALYHVTEALSAALEQFEGVVIAGPRSGSKTQNLSIPQTLAPDIQGLNCTVEYVETLRPDARIALAGGGCFEHWFEKLEDHAGVIERTDTGAPAVVRQNNVMYLAGWPDQSALMRVIQGVCAEQGVPVELVENGLRIRDTSSHRFVFNYGAKPAKYRGDEIPAAGVKWYPLG